MKTYYVYIITNHTRTVVYIGVTGNLSRRTCEHVGGLKRESFTSKYKCKRLVYYEEFHDVNEAIAREKQLKGWRRSRKEALINTLNPRWDDLFDPLMR